MTAVKWPNEQLFFKAVQRYAKELTDGLVTALDPASGGSSLPGYCVLDAGEVLYSGTLALPKDAPIQTRLAALYHAVRSITAGPPDVFVLERIRGQMAHQHLHWACGTSLAAAGTERVIEVPVSAWHALRRAEGSTAKGDESDAIFIGRTVVRLAEEILDGRHTELLSARKGAKGGPKGNPFARGIRMGKK